MQPVGRPGELPDEQGSERRRPLGDGQNSRRTRSTTARGPGCRSCHVVEASASTRPAAAPVAVAGVIMPPTAPVRRKSAVASGFRIRMTAARKGQAGADAEIRMLRPFLEAPATRSSRCRWPSPANAIAGMASTTDLRLWPGQRRHLVEHQAHGDGERAMATARMTNR